MMCCGKMIRLPVKVLKPPDEKERKALTTRDISVNLDKEIKEINYDNNKTSKRKFG
jgi:hypothetical protein